MEHKCSTSQLLNQYVEDSKFCTEKYTYYISHSPPLQLSFFLVAGSIREERRRSPNRFWHLHSSCFGQKPARKRLIYNTLLVNKTTQQQQHIRLFLRFEFFKKKVFFFRWIKWLNPQLRYYWKRNLMTLLFFYKNNILNGS